MTTVKPEQRWVYVGAEGNGMPAPGTTFITVTGGEWIIAYGGDGHHWRGKREDFITRFTRKSKP